MAWYTTGTVTVTNGSATITGAGTAFVENALAGDAFIGPDGFAYEVMSVTGATGLTIRPTYRGSTAAGQAYSIQPTQGRLLPLNQSVNALITDYSAIATGIGSGLFPDGTAAAPALRFGLDTDTGITRLGTNAIGIATGGVVRARVTTLGVGISGLGTAFSPFCNLESVAAANSVAMAVGTTPGAGSLGLDLFGLIDVLPGNRARGYVATGDSSIGTAGDLLIAPRSSTSARIRFLTGLGGATDSVIIGANGDTGIGTTTPAARLHARSAASDAMTLVARFETVNVAGTDNHNCSISVDPTANIVRFQSNGTGAGGFEYYSGTTARYIFEAGGIFRYASDNTLSLGAAANRFSVIYAGTGTINTSDANDKLWRGAMDAAELRAAKRIAAELGFYQWLAKIDEVGVENARFHFGVRAQAVWAIMADEGLVDPLDEDGKPGSTPYAFLCWDEWPEVVEDVTAPVEIPAVISEATGEEIEPARTEMQPTGETAVTRPAGNRFGIRPDQLALFLIAGQEARLAALEAAL